MATEMEVLEQIKTKYQPPAEEAQAVEEESTVADDVEEDTTEALESDVSDEEGDEELDATDEEETSESDDGSDIDFSEYSFTYTADGEDHEVNFDELMRLASAGHNYSRRQQELKQREERVDVLEKVNSDYAQQRQRLVDTLGYLEEQLTSGGYSKEQLAEMARTDPNKYAQVRAELEVNNEHLNNVLQAKAEERKQHEALVQQQLMQQWQETVRTYPELNSQEGRQPYADYLSSKGFAPEEMVGLVDKRLYAIMKDAIAGSQIRDKKQLARKKVANAPKVTKRKAASSRQQRQAVDRAKVIERARSGDRGAALQMFMAKSPK